MSRPNKATLLIAISAVTISVVNESDFVIKNYRSGLGDAPLQIDNLNSGKRGKKGKLLKDWH